MPYPGPGIKLPAELAGVVETYRMQCQYWRKRALTAEESNEELETENSELKTEVQDLKTENAVVKSEDAKLRGKMELSQTELADHKRSVENYAAKIDRMQRHAQRLLQHMSSMDQSHVAQVHSLNKQLDEEKMKCTDLEKVINAFIALADEREFGDILRDVLGGAMYGDVLLDEDVKERMKLESLAEAVARLANEEDVNYDPSDMPGLVRSVSLMVDEFNTFLHAFRPTVFEVAFKLWHEDILPATCPDLSESTDEWILSTLKPVMLDTYEQRMEGQCKKWNEKESQVRRETGQKAIVGLRSCPVKFSVGSVVDFPQGCSYGRAWAPKRPP